jgi:ABC-2 type transport system ATP-binding protein
MSATGFAFRTSELSRTFQIANGSELRALDGITLDVPAGIVFGFLGPNGAGKTTTIRLLLGLLEPSHGSAEVLGFDTRSHGQQIRERTGALLEHSGLYERLSAFDNLDLFGRIWHMKHADRHARIRALLEQFGLWDRRADSVGTWSRGMKQKLAVARAILHRPQLVFLDEPTAGLDPIAAAALREDLANLADREGTSIFLTTHNLMEAERLCSYIGVIGRGRLLAAGHPDELRARIQGTRVDIVARNTVAALPLLAQLETVVTVHADDVRLTIEMAPGASVAPVVSLLVQHGAEIEEVRKGAASLEEVFMALVDEHAR